jgi:hypothetical protein
MRILRTCLVAMTVIVGGLSLPVIPAIAWSDTLPHYATNSGCTTHVNTPYQYFTGSSFTFNLCAADSQATSMQADIYDSSMNWLCGLSTTGSFIAVPCTGIPVGTVTATVSWYVGSSPQMSHADGFKRTR